MSGTRPWTLAPLRAGKGTGGPWWATANMKLPVSSASCAWGLSHFEAERPAPTPANASVAWFNKCETILGPARPTPSSDCPGRASACSSLRTFEVSERPGDLAHWWLDVVGWTFRQDQNAGRLVPEGSLSLSDPGPLKLTGRDNESVVASSSRIPALGKFRSSATNVRMTCLAWPSCWCCLAPGLRRPAVGRPDFRQAGAGTVSR